MSFVATAIVGSAVIGGVSSYLGAEAQADAAAASADASLTASRESNELTREMYEQGREDLEPWMIAGENALGRLESQPDFKFTASEFEFMADPSYDFRKQEGINALDQSAASRGRVLSGAQDKAVVGYAGDMASQEYSNAYSRWQSEEGNRFNRELSEFNANESSDRYLAGQGQASAAGVAGAGAQMASTSAQTSMAGATAAGNAYMAAGDATAAGYAGVATAANQGIENFLLAPSPSAATSYSGFNDSVNPSWG